jgi:hypothetical protein
MEEGVHTATATATAEDDDTADEDGARTATATAAVWQGEGLRRAEGLHEPEEPEVEGR